MSDASILAYHNSVVAMLRSYAARSRFTYDWYEDLAGFYVTLRSGRASGQIAVCFSDLFLVLAGVKTKHAFGDVNTFQAKEHHTLRLLSEDDFYIIDCSVNNAKLIQLAAAVFAPCPSGTDARSYLAAALVCAEASRENHD